MACGMEDWTDTLVLVGSEKGGPDLSVSASSVPLSISARLPQSFLRFRFPPRWPLAGGHCPAATTRFMRAAVAWSPAASNASPSVLATQPRFSLAHARGPSTGGSRYGTVPAVRLKAGSDVQHHEERSDCSCRGLFPLRAPSFFCRRGEERLQRCRGQLAARCSSPAAKPPKDASGSSRWRTLAASEPSRDELPL